MASQLFIYLAYVIPLALIWITASLELLPILSKLPKFTHHFIYYAPIYAVLGLGVYAVSSVVYGVASFNDCGEAKEELVQEIKEARADLKKRKIID